MTREEFYDKYGHVVVTFSSYYKYTFTFVAQLPDGSLLSVGYGGNSNEIYQFSTFAGQEITVRELQPFMGGVYDGGKELEGFYDY